MIKKYEYKGKVEQEAAKYCDMGFYPICKFNKLSSSTEGNLTILSPLRDGYGQIVTSLCLADVDEDSGEFSFYLQDNTLESIVGFWEPTYEPFKVGDRVKLKESYRIKYASTAGRVYIIKRVNEDKEIYEVAYELPRINTPNLFPFHSFIPCVDNKPEIKELTLQEIADKFNIPLSHIRIKD